jgi:acetyl esterase/lipase
MPGFERSMKEMFSSTARPRPASPPDPQQMAAGLAPQLEDARAAFTLIRRRAAEWKIDPARIGMVGFSAGAMLTLLTELAGQDAKPAFIGIIYGPLAAVTVPADAPPLFVALAADDPFFANGGFGLIESWRAAKKPAEFHLYEQGGHGFGMYPKGWPSPRLNRHGRRGNTRRARLFPPTVPLSARVRSRTWDDRFIEFHADPHEHSARGEVR